MEHSVGEFLVNPIITLCFNCIQDPQFKFSSAKNKFMYVEFEK